MQMGFVVVRTDLCREQPEAVRRYLRAHRQAVRWIEEHQDEARALVARRLHLTKEVARRIVLLKWSPDGRSDAEQLEETQKTLLTMGVTRRPLVVRDLLDETVLERDREGR
jgi:ABC-type nitrate/sulfonate/bicarbonate transport system substrate-binding protein